MLSTKKGTGCRSRTTRPENARALCCQGFPVRVADRTTWVAAAIPEPRSPGRPANLVHVRRNRNISGTLFNANRVGVMDGVSHSIVAASGCAKLCYRDSYGCFTRLDDWRHPCQGQERHLGEVWGRRKTRRNQRPPSGLSPYPVLRRSNLGGGGRFLLRAKPISNPAEQFLCNGWAAKSVTKYRPSSSNAVPVVKFQTAS